MNQDFSKSVLKSVLKIMVGILICEAGFCYDFESVEPVALTIKIGDAVNFNRAEIKLKSAKQQGDSLRQKHLRKLKIPTIARAEELEDEFFDNKDASVKIGFTDHEGIPISQRKCKISANRPNPVTITNQHEWTITDFNMAKLGETKYYDPDFKNVSIRLRRTSDLNAEEATVDGQDPIELKIKCNKNVSFAELKAIGISFVRPELAVKIPDFPKSEIKRIDYLDEERPEIRVESKTIQTQT